MKIKKLAIALLLPVVMLITLGDDSCQDEGGSTNSQQKQQQEQLAAQAQQQVGMPGVTNFTERKLVRKLYELRDQNIRTFSYVPDLEGRLWHLCDSIGYGLPYGVQFTNPEAHYNGGGSGYNYNLPQPEPNALFMPSTAEGTWVICADPKGEPSPVYVEPRVIVSPFKLHATGEYQEK